MIPIDILTIILRYVEPSNLIKFFIKHHLDFNLKFQYDAVNEQLEIQSTNIIFNNFPNISLKSINIINIGNSLKLNFSLTEARICKFYGIRFIDPDGEKLDIYGTLSSLKFLQICPNITHLTLGNVNIQHIAYLTYCKQLKELCIDVADSDIVRDQQINLSKLINTNVKILILKHFDQLTLPRCPKIKHLEIIECNCSLDIFRKLEEYSNLKTFKFHGYIYEQKKSKSKSKKDIFNGYAKLQNIDWVIRDQRQYEILNKCKKLKKVVLRNGIKILYHHMDDFYAEHIFNSTLLDKCTEIRYIDISNMCINSFEIMWPNLRYVVVNSKQHILVEKFDGKVIINEVSNNMNIFLESDTDSDLPPLELDSDSDV